MPADRSAEGVAVLRPVTWREAKDRFEKRYLQDLSRSCDTLLEAARVSGINRTSLHRKYASQGIDTPFGRRSR